MADSGSTKQEPAKPTVEIPWTLFVSRSSLYVETDGQDYGPSTFDFTADVDTHGLCSRGVLAPVIIS